MNKPIKDYSRRDQGWSFLFTEVPAVQQPVAHNSSQQDANSWGSSGREGARFNHPDFLGGGWGIEVVCRCSWWLRPGNAVRRCGTTSAAKMTAKCEMKGDSVIGQDPHMWLKQC